MSDNIDNLEAVAETQEFDTAWQPKSRAG